MLSRGKLADRLPRTYLQQASELQNQEKNWLHQESIQGFGIAKRITAGQALPERVLKVYIDQKKPESKLGELKIPRDIYIPSQDVSLPIDVEAIGTIYAQNFQHFHRPLFRGLSIGLENSGGGTLGCFVRKRGDKDSVYLLSAAHVLDQMSSNTNHSKVYQPATESNVPEQGNLIANVTETSDIDTQSNHYGNRVDAGIAKVLPNVEVRPSLTKGATGRYSIGTEVTLVGATTGRGQVGQITDIDGEVFIRYSGPNRKAGFRNQVISSSFSSGGDSGAIVLKKKSNQVIGLLIGGTDSISIFTPIQYVLDALGIDLIIADTPQSFLHVPLNTSSGNSTHLEKWENALKSAITSGCSAKTHSPGGVNASHYLAKADESRANTQKPKFEQVGKEQHIPASIIAAIASRESRTGMRGILDRNGYGDRGNGYGIMQVDRRYHSLLGLPDPSSLAHIRQATQIFADNLEKVSNKHPTWNDSDVLKGAMVAYNSGVKNVQSIANMDRGTTHNDYGADVMARAQFYQQNGF